jgi:hypothetical protein
MSVDWVECRSDHDYIGRPLAFSWQGVRFEVAEVLVKNRTPSGYQFKVRTPGFEIFELEYDSNTDQWSVQQL